MSGEVQKWHLQKWLEKERPGTWRGLDILHINAILEAYKEYVEDSSDGTFLDISLEVFLARWVMLAKAMEEKEGTGFYALYWEQRRK